MVQDGLHNGLDDGHGLDDERWVVEVRRWETHFEKFECTGFVEGLGDLEVELVDGGFDMGGCGRLGRMRFMYCVGRGVCE